MKERAESKIRNKKIMIALMEYIVTLGCLLVAFVMISGKKIEQTSSYAKPEEVTKYEVVDNEYLTRVRPLTTYEAFKKIAENTLNRQINVYKDANKTEEVIDGIITSGMVLEVINDETDSVENKDYTICVVGDLTKNGDCNVTELTRIIRDVVGLEIIENREEQISIDFNKDGKVDVVDITMCIRYIVYGELPADLDIDPVPDPEPEPEPEPEPQPDPEPVNIPNIVVTGEGNTDWYRSDVRVEIQENGENIEKTLSRFEINLKDEDETRIQSTGSKKILIRDEGKYKITSQSFGKDGGRSELVTKEINIDKTKPTLTLSREDIDKTSCKIVINGTDDNGIRKYSIQKEDEEEKSSEEINEQEIRGAITVTEDGKYKVTVEDLAGNTTEKEINIKGVSTRYIVTFKNEDGSIISEKEYLEDEILEIPQNPSKQEDNTYTYEFAGWSPEVEETVTGNKEYIATYKSIYKNYTVTFKNEDGTILTTKTDYHYGDKIQIPENPSKQEDNTYTYEFAGWNEEVLESVTENKEYTATYSPIYKNYTVTFKNEDGTILTTKNDYHYGDKILIPENPIKEQDETYTYEFKGWQNKAGEIIELSEETEVLANEEYTAVYESEYREYTITFWNEDKTQVIERKTFTAEDKEIEEPEISQDREGYIGYWTYYEIELKDIDVQLYYVQERTNGDSLTETIDGIKWVGTYQDGKAIDVHYDDGQLGETVKIPATLEGYPVINICSNNEGVSIFKDNTQNIKEVIITNNVTSIGNSAFSGCSSLTNIDMPNVTSIGNSAFYNCSSLTEIEMPNVTTIGEGTFYSCSSLERVTAPKLTIIDNNSNNYWTGSFSYCLNLKEVDAPNVTSIGNYAFYNCGLTSVDMSNVTSIGNNAFQGCSSLTKIDIPNVTNIGDYAFNSCGSLTEIEMTNITSIGNNTFANCNNLTEVYMPNVTSIGTNVFYQCRNLSDIYLGNEEQAASLNKDWRSNIYVHYEDCTHTITIDNNIGESHIEEVEGHLENEKIKCLDTYKFRIIDDNTGEIIKNKVANITSQGQFINSASTTEYMLPDEAGIYTIRKINRNKIISFREIQNGKQYLCEINGITWKFTYQDGRAEDLHHYAGELGENVEIPSKVNNYPVISLFNRSRGPGNSIFKEGNSTYNTIIKTVTIPETVTDIGDSAFYRCSNLKKVNISNSVENISNAAFYNCTNLHTINIPNSVNRIGAYVFENCVNLTNIYIDNFEENIELSDDLNQYGYVHYKNCKHDLLFEKNTNKEISIETVGENGEDGHIECNKDYNFRILDKDGNIVTTEKVLVRYAGMENIENEEYYRTIRRIDNSSNMFESDEEGIRELLPGKDGIYSIEKIHRNVTIIIGIYEIEDENEIKWNYSIKDGKAINVSYAGGTLGETVTIPSQLDGYPVENLFNKEESGNIFAKAKDTSVIKNIIIGNGISKIGKYAFYKLGSLQTIEIPSSITEIDFASFYNCEGLQQINIPNSVIKIEGFAFNNCNSLTNIEIPNSVTEMGMSVFSICNNLESVRFSNNIETIPEYTFYGCSKLNSINNIDNVIIIGEYAFYNCEKLTEVNMSNVTNVRDNAFYSCRGITNIEMPNVTSIGQQAFYECSGLMSIEMPNIKSIGNETFVRCNSLTAIDLPKAESIEDGAFSQCGNLINVNIPNVTSIGQQAFYECSGLMSIEMPNIKSIGNGTFVRCNSLTAIDLPKAESIGDGVFSQCGSLINVNIPNVTSIENQAFEECSALTSINMPNVTNIGPFVFRSCSSLKSINIPNLTSIGGYAFGECSSLTEINIPNVTSIGEIAFSECSSLTELNLPNVTSIGMNVFNECINLKNIYFNNKKEDIRGLEYAGDGLDNAQIHYKDCKHSIKFANYTPENINIEFIDKEVNNENIPCKSTYQFRLVQDNEIIKNRTLNITEIGKLGYYKNIVENKIEIEPDEEGIYTIEKISRDYDITLGEKYTQAQDENGITWEYTYQNGNATNVHYYSGELGQTVEIPNTLNGYPVVSLYNDSGSTGIFGYNSDIYNSVSTVRIPENVTIIGENAFNGYYNINNIECSENIIDVGAWAFDGTSYYDNLPDGEVYIGKVLYKYKGAMPENTSITVREGTVTISDWSFANKLNLKNINIPDSVTKIGNNAFALCGFDSIELLNVSSIGDRAFYQCFSLTDIYLGNNEEENISLGENWNYNAYVHFGDCMQDITIINEFKNIAIEEISNNLIDGKIKCREAYQFKLINEGSYSPVVKVTSQGQYTNYDDVTETITPDENGIYTISNINRNKTIRIGRNNGEQLQAEDENGIIWNYTYQDGNATKVYYESGELGKTVSIPNELVGYPVVQIASNNGGQSIFKEKAQNIKNIIIPNSITNIGHFAFYGCNGLTNIEIPSSVTNIDYNAFSDCSNLSDYYIDNESGKYSYNFNYNNGYIHYKDCKHTISFDLDSENIMAIEQITENEAENMSVNCGETFKFRLINTSDNSIIHNKKLFARSEGKFHHSGYIIEALSPDEEGIYTIENINRDKTIIETIENGMKMTATDENNITWQFTYQDGKAEDVHYYDGELGENVVIPSELYGYPVISLYNRSYYGSIFARQSYEINNTISTVQIPNSVTKIGDYAFRDCVKISTINIPSNVTKIGSGVFYECISLTNIYIDNLEENISIDDDLNRYGYVHYSDCKHDIAFEKYTSEDIELQTVGEKGQDGHIECNENYQFKLVDKNGDPVTTEKVLVRYAGLENEIDENDRDYYDRVRRLLDNSSNMFASEEEGIRELQVGEDGIYTVEKVHRNITIIVGSYQTTDENNITWNYSIEDDKAINVYYAGGELGDTVTIPSELDGHQVVNLYNKEESGNIFAKAENPEVVKNVVIQNGITNIDKYAFYKLGSLETISIPDSVTEIGYASFYSCESLKEINIPTRVTTIGAWAFNCCIGLTNIEIPDSVTEIGKAAFSTCKNLENIRLPSNLAVIEDILFINCEKLNNIEIPDGVTSIGSRAFYYCSGMEKIKLPNTISEIKEYAFYSCNSLSEINIPDHVTELNENTFSWCNNLISIEIPSSVTKLNAPFSGCSNLKDIYIDNYEENLEIKGQEGKPWYNMGPPVNAQIHYKNCTHSVKLRKYMEDNTEIESVTEGVDNENIPCGSNYQFKLVKDGEIIKDKTITITELGITKYYDVEKEIEPNEEGIYTIDNISRNYIIVIGEKYQQETDENDITWEYTYEDGRATNVHYYSGQIGTNLEIPNMLNGYPVVNLYKENSDGNPTNILGNDWSVYGGVQTITIPEGVTSIGDDAFCDCSNLISVILPDSMEYIGNRVFQNCNQLQNINLPDNIKKIGQCTFYRCNNLKNVELPSGLTVIEEYLFNDCSNLKNITIKNNVKEIKNCAFRDCRSLERLDIPEGVTTIGNSVFSSCYNLSTIAIPDSISAVYDNCGIDNTPYYNNLPNGEFYMGKVLYSYKGKEQMPENTTIIVKEGTETIKQWTFEGCTNLVGVELPDSVTRVELCAFKDCTNLSYIQMSKNIKYIGNAAFENCTSLKEIVVWRAVEELRERTFDKWTNEQTVNFEVEEVQESWDKDWNKNCKAQIVFGYTGE